MSSQLKRLGILSMLAALLLAFGLLRSGLYVEEAEADLAVPGGIGIMPTLVPNIPGAANQELPGIIRARPPGNYGLVSVFCDPLAQAPGLAGGSFPGPCADKDADGTHAIEFEIVPLYPPGSVDTDVSFAANGSDRLVCNDNTRCDYSSQSGVVVVQVNGGGANEIVEVRATDEFGESRSVQLVVVDTIMAFGPTGPVSTASQVDPIVVVYSCDDVGRMPISPLSPLEQEYPVTPGVFFAPDVDLDGVVGLDDQWDLMYHVAQEVAGASIEPLDNNVAGDVDVPLYWCGGDTETLLDDTVTFETDISIFSIDPAAAAVQANMATAAENQLMLPPLVDLDCDEGKSVSVTDVNALEVWRGVLLTADVETTIDPETSAAQPEGGCDLDFSRNGVVSYLLLGTGELGTAEIKAQQGGGVSPPRTIYASFVGEATISLFLEAPAVIGPEGGKFGVAIVDPNFRPVASETLSCTVDPPDGALMVVPPTGTTGDLTGDLPGQVEMRLVPTGKAVEDSETLTLICQADRHRSVVGVAVVTVSSTPVTEDISLVAACNPLVSTWPDDTGIETIAEAVAPAEALDGLWALDFETGVFEGFSPAAPEASDLQSIDRLEAFFACTNAVSTITRPVI